METARKLAGRWKYLDEEQIPGTVVEYKRVAPKQLSAGFIIQDEPIAAKMACTVSAEGLVMEETGDDICNRYEGKLNAAGNKVSGKWTCTKSSLKHISAGDSGSFEMTKDESYVPPKEPIPAERFKGVWVYGDESTESDGATCMAFRIAADGSLSAAFVYQGEEGEEESELQWEMHDDGLTLTIKEVGEYIANDYVGTISPDGSSIKGKWTCTSSEDESTAVGDSGNFNLVKKGQ